MMSARSQRQVRAGYNDKALIYAMPINAPEHEPPVGLNWPAGHAAAVVAREAFLQPYCVSRDPGRARVPWSTYQCKQKLRTAR